MYLTAPSSLPVRQASSNLGLGCGHCPGRNCGRCSQAMGFFRPNQALMRGRYASNPSLAGMGAFNVDPTLLALGAGAALLAGILFFGKKRGGEKRRIARLAAQRALATRELREAGA